MSATLLALGIDKLSVAERVALIKVILDSIAAEQDPGPTDTPRTELERRVAGSRANPAAGVPWDQIKSEALARFEK